MAFKAEDLETIDAAMVGGALYFCQIIATSNEFSPQIGGE